MGDPRSATAQPGENKLLLELSREVTGTLDLQEVLNRSFLALRRLVDFDGGAIQLIRDGALMAVATDPQAPPEVFELRIPIGQGVSGGIAATGEYRYIPDIAELASSGFRATSGGVRSYFGWPMILHGEVAGVVQVDSTHVDAFSPDDQTVLLRFAPSIAMAVQNALVFERQKESMMRLQEAEQMKRDFMSVVSHELRTPLASIIGFAETLVRSGEELPLEVVRESCDRILASGRRLQSMIDDLLDLSEIEREGATLDLQPVDVIRVIKEATFQTGQTSHRIIAELPADLPKVIADDGKLHQVLEHFLENARHFSPEDKPIVVAALHEGDRVTVSVGDQGRGIPSHLLTRVFEPFFQIEDTSTRTVGGLGVGLYLVKEICTAMNIDVEVWSEPDIGSRFSLRIPLAQDL